MIEILNLQAKFMQILNEKIAKIWFRLNFFIIFVKRIKNFIRRFKKIRNNLKRMILIFWEKIFVFLNECQMKIM